MRISCDHCGAVFDSDQHPVCPECGAAYGDSPEVKSVEDYEQRKRDSDLEKEKERLEAQRRRNELFREELEQQRIRNANRRRTEEFSQKMNKGCYKVLIVAGVIFILLVLVGVKLAFDEAKEEKRNVPTTAEPTTEIQLRNAEGAFGEEIDAGRYSVRVDRIEKTEYYPWSGTKDHTCVLIHFLVTNHLDRDINTDIDTHIVADGIAQHTYYLPDGYRELTYRLPKGLTAEGWVKCEIPDNAQEMEFRFGDAVVCRFTWENVSE